jgi:hypothetical protein
MEGNSRHLFKVRSRHLLGVTEETHGNLRQDRLSTEIELNQRLREYKAEMLTTRQ